MGFLSKFQGNFGYMQIRDGVAESLKRNATSGDLNRERFDILTEVWRETLFKLEAFSLGNSPDHYVKFPATFGSPDLAISFTSQLIAMAVLKDFKETRFMEELRGGFIAFEANIRKDHGESLSKVFADLNPGGDIYFASHHRRRPFVEVDADLMAALLTGSHKLT